MDDPVQAYELLRPKVEQFADRLAGLLNTLLDEERVSIYSVEHRAKKTESLRAKISRPDKSYDDPLREIPDLCGLRIICYHLEDTDRIEQLIRKQFVVNEDESEDKLATLDVNEFGYLSIHLVVSLSPERKHLAEWKKFGDLHAEIQVRTVLQHSWAAISHALQYKKEVEVPRSLRRRLHRLSGLLELADEQFLSLRKDHKKLEESVSGTSDTGLDALKVDRISILEFLARSDLAHCIRDSANQAGFTVKTMLWDDYTPRVAQLCEHLGITTIGEMRHALEQVMPLHKEFFEQARRLAHGPWAADVPFLVLILLVASRRDQLNVDVLVRQGGWSEVTADTLLAAVKKTYNRL